MDNSSDIVARFYHEIISSDDFNGDYFHALIQAYSCYRAFCFIKDFYLKKRS